MASFNDSVIFQLDGGRELLTGSRMEELLASIPVDIDPTIVRLSNKSFSVEAAEVVAARLKTFKNVVIADISDIIAGRPEEEALQALSIICNSLAGNQLKELNISDNALGSKGVHACSSLISIKSIERLYICNNGMAAESAVLISDILLNGGCPPLQLLHYYNNMSGNDGAAAIGRIVSQCPALTDFRFSATRSNAVGCLAVAKALESLTGLVHLDLVDNIFSGEAGTRLANALRVQVKLRSLVLRDAGLGGNNSKRVFQALAEAKPSLTVLDVSGNEFESDECEALRDLFASTTSLTKSLVHFHCDENEIGSEGISLIASTIRPNKFVALQTLSANTCEITAAGAYRLCSRLAALPRFQQLKIDGNQICERAVVEIQRIFAGVDKTIEAMEDNDEDGDDDLDEATEEELDESEEDANAPESEEPESAADAAAIDELADELTKTAIA